MKMLLVLAITAAALFGLNAADLAGSWKGSTQTQMGATDVTITFNPGGTLAGKVNAAEYEGAIENARLDGDKISFEANMAPGKVAFEGTVACDEMKLTMTGTQGDKYALVCNRQK